ncbi:MAG: Hsp20/alpha crystallin family protein [Acidobacteriaceae bacterium]
MDEIYVSPDSMRRIWHVSEDFTNSLTDTSRWRIFSHPRAWRPPTDVYETEDALIIRVEVAGMRDADFTISLEKRILTIRGLRQDTPERRAYHQMEIPFGEFSTELELPYKIETDKVEATYQDGFLRLKLPITQPKHIKVEGK